MQVSIVTVLGAALVWSALPSAAATAHFKVRQVAAGAEHACALLTTGKVKCWGANTHGQLGLGDDQHRGDDAGEMGNALPFVEAGGTGSVAELALGSAHSCARYSTGVLKCWGANTRGQLGLGNTDDRGDEADEMNVSLPAVNLGTGRTVDRVVAGHEHTCALLDDGSVKCWGRNDQGQLGYGDTRDRGDGLLEMGNFLPAVDLGPGRIATQLAAGYSHTCALLDDDSIKCWGGNAYGQLGIGSTFNRGDDPLEMGTYLQEVDLGTVSTPLELVAGNDHNCVLLADGLLTCWGRNDHGELGRGHARHLGDQLFELGGMQGYALLHPDYAPTRLVAAGSFHSCIIDGGELFCWGHNITGQLGLGDRDDRGDGTLEMSWGLGTVDLGAERQAVQMSLGWIFSCARLGNERIKCWGSNAYGQLGVGDRSNRGSNAGQMGDSLAYVDLGGDESCRDYGLER